MSTGEPRLISKYELPRGASVGKYEILRKIATGGMAELYLARVRGTAGFEKVVVLKRILPGVAEDPEFVNMFLDEARLAATLQHPNIADVYDSGQADGQYFFTMEFVHGQDVRTIRHEMKKRNEPVPLAASLAIIHGTASALDYAHERRTPDGKLMGLVHRDVSASNVMVSYDGAVKLLDFGIARVMSATHKTQVGTLKGKVPYMSPEQCKGLQLDRRSDLFSLGVVLFELTVGRRPFRGDSDFAVMDQIVYQGAPKPTSLIPSYPAELEAIVMKLLERDPKARYTTADELVDDLDAFIQKYGLWLSPKQLGKYMRTVFEERIKAWEEAEKQGVSFVQHVADSVTSQSAQSELLTPPSAFPAVERRSSQMAAAQSPEIAASLRPTPPSMQAVQPPPSRPTPPPPPKPGFVAPAQLPFSDGDKSPAKASEGWDAPTEATAQTWDTPDKAGEGWDAPTTDFRGESPTKSEDLQSLALGAEAMLRPPPSSVKAQLPLRAPPPGMTPPAGLPATFAPSPRSPAGRAASDTFTPPTIPDTSHAPGFVPGRAPSPGYPPPSARASSPERLRPPTASGFASDAAGAAIGAPAFSDAVPAQTPILESQPYPTLRPRSSRIFLFAVVAALAIGAGVIAFMAVSGDSSSRAAASVGDGSEVKAESKPLDVTPTAVETPKTETPKSETPKIETPKVEIPKPEAPKAETPKVEAPKQPVAKQPVAPKPPVIKKQPVKHNPDSKDSSWDPNSPFLPQ